VTAPLEQVAVPDWIRAFYTAVDSLDSDALAPLLDDNCAFRVGNAPAITGRENVVEGNRAVTAHFSALRHEIVDVAGDDDRVFVECWVDYTMGDGTTHLLPFVSAFERTHGLISSVKLFGDMSPLHAGGPS
jgi:hypothetical protein